MLKEKNQRISTWLAFALLPLSGFATDIYIPSLPSMGADMHITAIQVQFTLTAFLITYGTSQLFIGVILDSFGRYRMSLIALFIFTISCVLIAITRNIYLIYLMRVIHGITIAFIIVAKRALFVDIYKGKQLQSYLSMFTIIWSAGPIVAPFIGGYFQNSFGWQSNFYFLGGLGAILFVLELIYSGETLTKPVEFNLKRIAGVYAGMIKTTSFSLGILILAFGYSMVMIYNMTGPYIIEHHLQLTPVVAGYCSLILGFAWMVGGFISKAVISKPFYSKLSVNIALQVVFVGIMIISINFVSNLYSMVFFAFLIHVCAGFTYNNYFAYCLGRFPDNAATAGGLTGGAVYIILSFLTYGVVNLFPAKDERNLSYSYLVFIFLSAVVMWVLYRMNKRAVKLSAV